jgi:(E)-4-hydroxy-3-methylbut-2-enyl-diphosphate synthase
MTTTDTRDTRATGAQIAELAAAGCDLVRVAVPDAEAADALHPIVAAAAIPVVADIHFDYRLALAALEAGVAKLRLNPGNIGTGDRVRAVADAARERNVPIRIGVNAGSLERDLLHDVEAGTCTLADALVRSALREAAILEESRFHDIVISVKASQVPATIAAYRALAERCDYPLHLGVTEAGTRIRGIVKSAVGVGTLLAEGIGDTLRVSLSSPPVEEVRIGRLLLQALELRAYGPDIVSCPTCGRCQVDVIGIAEELERRIGGDDRLRRALCTVAVMGCVVNGPGEARAADVGFAGGTGEGLLFRKGEPVCKIAADEAVDRLVEEIRALCGDQQ